MEDERARALLNAERHRLETLLAEATEDGRSDRAEQSENGNFSDPAERLTAEGADDALVSGLRNRLEALDRADERLISGTYGRSGRSGQPIPYERLEADPAAELTVDEAADEGSAVG